jgi:hypothetical protein
MPAKKVVKGGKTVYGPYPGSKQNNGRPIYVERDNSTGKTTSTNAARAEKEKSIGKSLPRSEHVAHKSGTNKGGNRSISPSSTRVESAKKNIGDGNKTRSPAARKSAAQKAANARSSRGK